MVEPSLPGPIDVHAHHLSDDVTWIPHAGGSLRIEQRDGQLHLGEVPMAITWPQLSDPALIVAEMDAVGLGTRVLSPPPYAFASTAGPGEQRDHTARVNKGLRGAIEHAPDRLVGFGIVASHPDLTVADLDAELVALTNLGLSGVAIPPQLGTARIDQAPLRQLLERCEARGLPVLVHPLQEVRAGLDAYYLNNLLGNGAETAAAIGALLLCGMLDELPELRIAFVHGGGCAPAVLGRWDHAWQQRSDVSAATGRIPSQTFRDRIFVDRLTHDRAARELLLDKAGPDRLLLGSDRPFDMGVDDPTRATTEVGLDLAATTINAHRFLYGSMT